ncbi:TPA: hypothetical protein ACWMKV_003042 [Escherichia coli]|jgi:hypothetical protein|uniref:hypothetical protein n=1 Tax=Escherichia TaxID=561 RepID=UPI000A382D69|nr:MULTISPECIES: hypothetical protein [Escherichia]DAL92055.1 MAG TPA: hypothetical protein [Caudoviricetes sp.]EFN3713280.1 hypothetical protein [Escherichia coli]EFN9967292.1 hypothetical protein [Escherichia coli]EGF4726961.1 hypothetical protein [Escherichia coli]EGG1044880.1 hypothetical protein [Escherichia coli]
MAERYDVHAFKCEDNWSLFIWINDTGVKFIGRHADSYEQAKTDFLKQADAKRLASQSGAMQPLADFKITEKVEVFTL